MRRFRNFRDSRSWGAGATGIMGRLRAYEYGGGFWESSSDDVPDWPEPEADELCGFLDEAPWPGEGDEWRDRAWSSCNRFACSSCANCWLRFRAHSGPYGFPPAGGFPWFASIAQPSETRAGNKSRGRPLVGEAVGGLFGTGVRDASVRQSPNARSPKCAKRRTGDVFPLFIVPVHCVGFGRPSLSVPFFPSPLARTRGVRQALLSSGDC